MKKILGLMMVGILLIITGCSSTGIESSQAKETKETKKAKVELTISAAASLKDVLTAAQESFEKDHPNIKLSYNFASSGTLEQQILQGAPVDLFFSAAEDQFKEVEEKGFIDKKDAVNLVGNEIVLVVPKNSQSPIQSFNDLSNVKGQISIGTPESVPAGQYGKETLEHLHLWDSLKDKMVYAKDVRQVLSYIETNSVKAGIIYKTDAAISDKVKVIALAPSGSHTPVIYPLGILKGTSHPKEAKMVYDYLQSKKAKDIFKEYGFVTQLGNEE
ncbi:molybdate transport system substrate-binding protein [Pullulanibacillus pueri]|uniref:Putative ABC transporter substrate-binding lipoprotein YvgL n=1 Tax=Pullulanibacillus pueri TaxID=1437324 RepID=A0A8J2ZZ96_9BACL|nr:molybdate ABC transporter substrate-binding protein [Pullulanibacillus pueri]MBM7681005.1 molybdate transport system substrate-binding protein [Pullulanibacillus pueri]GGH86275.1 putative ABC transporter substrate-binding lipoprotein YvgL [Pullulanibacillus pueri]